MSSSAPFLHHLKMPEGLNVTEVTLPDSQLCHYITDGELEHLGEMRKEPVMEICLASAGVFAGSIVPAIEQVSRFNSATNPMGTIGLITCFIAVISLAVCVVTGILWRQRHGSHKGLLATIRARKRIPVKAE